MILSTTALINSYEYILQYTDESYTILLRMDDNGIEMYTNWEVARSCPVTLFMTK